MKKRNPAGRPTKLTPEIQKIIVDRVSVGVPLKYAAAAAGVGSSTLRLWTSKGRKGDKNFLAFVAALKKAEADAIARNVGLIQKSAADTWQAAAWFLERRHPDEFSSNRRELAELRKEVASLQKILEQITKAGSYAIGPQGQEPAVES